MTAPWRLPGHGLLLAGGARAAWKVAPRVPEGIGAAAIPALADLTRRRGGPGISQLEANLARAVPTASPAEIATLTRDAVRSYLRYWHEVFRMPSWSNSRIVDGVVTSGEASLRAGFGRGGGAIIALPHMANWDHAGGWACLTGMPVSTVVERLSPPGLFDGFAAYRRALGMEVVALTGDVNPLVRLRSALACGRLVCLLADRDMTGSGVEVRLLGERARLAAGPAVLSRMTGAPMVALTLSYRGPLLHLRFGPVIEIRHGRDGVVAMTQEIADWFGAGIARTPADWHMLQPVFSDDLAGASARRGATR